jgi:hypothetical protein
LPRILLETWIGEKPKNTSSKDPPSKTNTKKKVAAFVNYTSINSILI